MSTISVIIPIYNVEAYLHRCIDSVLAQTFTDFELVLVDDGSPDGCPAICDSYAIQDNRIQVFHRENQGVSAARNFGIDWVLQNSESEWITFIDSDDWVHPQMLELLWEAVTSQNVQIGSCSYINTEGEIPCINCTEYKPNIITPESFYLKNHVNFVVPWGKLYAREVFGEIRYPVGKRYEDEYTTYRILFQHKKMALLDAPLYFYFKNPTSFMNSKSSWSPRRLDALAAFEQQLAFFSKNGYDRCYQLRLKIYAWQLAQACWHIGVKNSEEYDKALSHKLRTKLRAAIFRMHVTGIWEQETDHQLYDAAFPQLVAFYWILLAAKKKIQDEGLGRAIQKGIRRLSEK